MWAQCLRLILLVVVLCSLSAQAQDRIADETNPLVSFNKNKQIDLSKLPAPLVEFLSRSEVTGTQEKANGKVLGNSG